MKTIALIISFLLLSLNGKSQFGRIEIETDSSHIELIRNSVYRVWEETYKYQDSVWYSVHFIKDTTKLHREGWRTKAGKHLGVWREYNFEGALMNTRDYEKTTCEINTDLYPYYDLLKKMKSKADSLIISTYSQAFFNNHVRFEFDCIAYDGKWKTYAGDEQPIWIKNYLGSWVEPLKGKPNSFKFRYSVKIGNSAWYKEMIGIDLDSLGRFVPSHDFWNNYGFEQVKTSKRTFQIEKLKAMEIAQGYGLKITDPEKVFAFLEWEKFKKAQFYDGQFRYYITELIDEIKYKEGKDRKGIIYKFNVYSFNPWTGEFIEKKKMKSRKEWSKNSGHRTGLLPDD